LVPATDSRNAATAPVAPARLAVPSVHRTLPMGLPNETVSATPEIARTLQSTAPAPMAAKARPPSNPPRKLTAARVILFIAAAIGATAFGMVIALLTHRAPNDAPLSRQAAPVDEAHIEPSAAVPPRTVTTEGRATALGPTAAAGSTAPGVTPQSLATASAPAATASVADTTTAAAATAASAAPSAAPPAPATSAQPERPAPVPPPSFDLRKLPRDRAALVVHSSANTHVFVHGVDYGSTNQALMTSCGIRFVRLGRALGDFLEPGQSYVIKCGKLNELTIEPR
ncbi:MAG TPA: hypothetical protein VLJ38_17625, partial [Polyangiaceae bacterium]|nr:hypothetical protein [Polyangiaceae bacterium]